MMPHTSNQKIRENSDSDIKLVGTIPIINTLLDVVCRSTGMGFATVAKVTEDKWIACAVLDKIAFGLEAGGELKIETTICNEVRQCEHLVVIDHVATDEVYKNHHTPALYGFQSYISVPIYLKNGNFFGTLCAIDPKPAELNNPKIIGMFNLFAELISFHIDASEQLKITEDRLTEEQKTAQLREQFIAILGHDLRNPLGTILNGTELLLTKPLEQDEKLITSLIKKSASRISGLIENILDFARGRLGEGITLNCKFHHTIESSLLQVIEEIRTLWPHQYIETHFNITSPVYCDENRVAQLFSNLVSNAITHGVADKPIIISAFTQYDTFQLSVANYGTKIPEEVMTRLFQPFVRGEVKREQQGLGLGLYISAEIARVHGGSINVESNEETTCFIVELPLALLQENATAKNGMSSSKHPHTIKK